MGKYSETRYANMIPTFEPAPLPASEAAAAQKSNMRVYETLADLPATSTSKGNTAFVKATNKLYVWNGVGWYLVAEVTNASPSSITGVNSTYDLATDGTATTITAVATDPEGMALTWSSSVTAGSLNGTTVSNVDNVFTITPHASNATTFSITFNVTDGVNGSVSAIGAFSLTFTPPLPTSGLTGLYDMNNSSSYSGTGSTWADVSGNYGPNLTINSSAVSYTASSIGGIPSLTLAAADPNGPIYYDGSAFTTTTTVVMIFAKTDTPYAQTYYNMFSNRTGWTVSGGSITVRDHGVRMWSGSTYSDGTTGSIRSSTTKLYIDKVDTTAYNRGQYYDAVSSSSNLGKYHSLVLTEGNFGNGFAFSSSVTTNAISPLGELRALVFYNRALSQSEVNDVHDHFAGDYTSSEMIQ